jgi:hypothetical protein
MVTHGEAFYSIGRKEFLVRMGAAHANVSYWPSECGAFEETPGTKRRFARENPKVIKAGHNVFGSRKCGEFNVVFKKCTIVRYRACLAAIAASPSFTMSCPIHE